MTSMEEEEEVDFGEGDNNEQIKVNADFATTTTAITTDNAMNTTEQQQPPINYSHKINPALIQQAMQLAQQRAQRFGSAPAAIDTFRLMMENAEASADLLIKGHGDVRHNGPITQILGPVSSNPEDGGNTIIVWATMPRRIGRCSLNIAIGQDHETFLIHFNPRLHRVRKYSRILLGTKREYIWDAGGTELKKVPIKDGQRFEWRCTINKTGFVIFLNGKFFRQYDHRISPADITEPIQLHVPNDKDNDNIDVHAVWWGHKTENVDSFENPQTEVGSIIAGFDLMSEQEQKKMAERNARFGNDNTGESEEVIDPNIAIDQEKRQARLERFGLVDPTQNNGEEEADGKKEKVRVPRREVPHNIKRRTNVLHMYGVDNLSNADIKDYFNGHNILGIRYLDGSSCNLQFLDEFEAKRALLSSLTDEAKNAAKDAGLDVFGYTWLGCKHYSKNRNDSYGTAGTEHDLFCRFATIHDVSQQAMDPPMQYHNDKADKAKIAKVGQQRFNQLMSSHSQNKKNRRRRRRRVKGGAKGAKGKDGNSNNDDFSEFDD